MSCDYMSTEICQHCWYLSGAGNKYPHLSPFAVAFVSVPPIGLMQQEPLVDTVCGGYLSGPRAGHRSMENTGGRRDNQYILI